MLMLKGENGLMNAGSDHGSAAKGSAIDLEVIGSGPVGCCFSFPPLSLTCVDCYLVFYFIANTKNHKDLYIPTM